MAPTTSRTFPVKENKRTEILLFIVGIQYITALYRRQRTETPSSLRIRDAVRVRFCNKSGVPNADVMQSTYSASEPLRPGEGRVQGPRGRPARIAHARLSSSEEHVSGCVARGGGRA
jgi:hypothetical protein